MPGTVLLLAYPFPPSGGIGAIRTAKTVKHLSRLGWRSVVLTSRGAPSYAPADASLSADLPPDALVRAVPARSAGFLLGAFRRAGLPAGAVHRLERLLFVPDLQVGWIPGAVLEGLRLVRRHRPRAIHASGDPWSVLVAGALLSRLTGVPYVAHFADEWTRDPWYSPPTPLHRLLSRSLEGWVLASAAAVTVPGPGFIRRFLEFHPDADPGRFVEVPNGYDEEDFRGEVRPDAAHFTLLHAGALYVANCDPQPFFRALARFVAEEPARRERIHVRLLGFVDREFRLAVEALGLSAVVRFEGSRSHREAVDAMRAADVLLSFLRPFDGAFLVQNAKCFEYLRAGRSILAMAPPGSGTADLLREAGADEAIPPDDEAGALARLRSLYSRWEAGLPCPGYRTEVVASHERGRGAAVLAGILEGLPERRGGRGR